MAQVCGNADVFSDAKNHTSMANQIKTKGCLQKEVAPLLNGGWLLGCPENVLLYGAEAASPLSWVCCKRAAAAGLRQD